MLMATKPLLRQIENLQAAHATQSNNWEKVENNLTQRLGMEKRGEGVKLQELQGEKELEGESDSRDR